MLRLVRRMILSVLVPALILFQGAVRLTAGNPVARWVADDWAGGDAAWVDRIGGKIAVSYGSPIKATGQFGSVAASDGIVFDGVNDYFEVAAVNNPIATRPTVTIVALFKANQGATGTDGAHWRFPGPINAEAPGEPNDFGLTVGADGAAHAFFNGNITTGTPVLVTDGRPHTLILTWSDAQGADKTARFYVDGVLRGSLVTDGGVGIVSNLIRFGRERETKDRWFRGTVGELRFYASLEDPLQLHRSMAGPDQLLINAEFTSVSQDGVSPTGWTSSVGFVAACGANCGGSDSKPAWDGNSLRFGFDPSVVVSQTVSVPTVGSLGKLVLEYQVSKVAQEGLYAVQVDFLDSAGQTLKSLREPASGWSAAPASAATKTLTLLRSELENFDQIVSARTTLQGYQSPYYWSGHYGPAFGFVRLWAEPLSSSQLLNSIAEDVSDAENAGTPVSMLYSGAIKGIAVTGIDTGNGSWHYSTDGGASWASLSGASSASARLLKADSLHRIRFTPNPNYNGTATIQYRAWDQVVGTDGALLDLTSTGGGAWALVAYGANASLGGFLNAASGNFSSSLRTGSAVLPALTLLKGSSELAMSWTVAGGGFPVGGIASYSHAIAFPLPQASAMSFDGSATSPPDFHISRDPAISFAVGSTHPDQSLVTVRTLTGSPGMPAQMYMRNKSFGAGYGGVYGLVMNNGNNPALDYGQFPDSQQFKAVYLDHGTGNGQQTGLVMGGSGGVENSYVPSTMALWVWLTEAQILSLAGGPVTVSGNRSLAGVGTTYLDVKPGSLYSSVSANTETGALVVTPVNDAPTLTVGNPGNAGLMSATGGTTVASGIYTVHKFLTSGTFTPERSGSVEVLLVGGGGGGGPMLGGGGGGGGVIHLPTVSLVAGTDYSIEVGAGGISGMNGNPTVAFGATAAGGGSSGTHDAGAGSDGGSGGGAASNNWQLNQGGASSGSSLGPNSGTIYGNRGGNMTTARVAGPTRGAGGGGAGASGKDTDPNITGDTGPTGDGSGGVGVLNTILGQDYYWGGGGGGGAYVSQVGGYGGLGGGGGGGGNGGPGIGGSNALTSGAGADGLNGGAGGANTGGGGGGGAWDGGQGGTGGSGIAIIRYQRSPLAYLDSVASDYFTEKTGQLVGADSDPNTVLSYGVVGGSVTGGMSSKTGMYGTLKVDVASGTYTYTPDASKINALGAGAVVTDNFTVSVSDSVVANPTTAVVLVDVVGANDAPTLTTVGTFTGAVEDTDYTITYEALALAANEADVDGPSISFRIEGVNTGILWKAGVAVTAGSTLLGPGESLIWRPAADASGTLPAFTVRAWDGTLASENPILVSVAVAAVDDTPQLLVSATGTMSASNFKAATGATADGVYTMVLNGVPTPVYCLMNNALDGGGWVLAMKGANTGSTFDFSSSYWTTANTLNTAATRRNDTYNEDAKFEVFNSMPASEILIIFPDAPPGGAITDQTYGFVWKEPMPTPANTTAYNGRPTQGDYTGKTLRELFAAGEQIFIRDAVQTTPYRAAGAGVFSTQTDVRFFGFNYVSTVNNNRVRFGFGWNENGGGLYPGGNEQSNDVSGGLGMDRVNWSAGDHIGCCADSIGLNRPMKFEIYVRGKHCFSSIFAEDVPGNLVFDCDLVADPDSQVVTVTLSVPSGSITANPADGIQVGGTPQARTVSGSPAGLNSYFSTAGNLTYLGASNSSVDTPLTLSVSDGYTSSSSSLVLYSIPVNDVPVALAQTVTTDEDTAKAITLSGTDVEGSALTYSVVTQPTMGVLSGTAPNLTYTPNANANGSDSFTFKVNDGTVDSAEATVSITVTAVNDAPVFSGLSTTYDAFTGFVEGPALQSAASRWQYLGGSVSGLTLLTSWKTGGNEVISGIPQWDGYSGYLDNYPFVQRVGSARSPVAAGTLVIHPANTDASVRAVAVGWKNTADQTVSVNFGVTLRLPYSSANGIDYFIQRGLAQTSRYLPLRSGSLVSGGPVALASSGPVEMQPGEMLYLVVDSKGDFVYDHTELSRFTVTVIQDPALDAVAEDVGSAANPGTAVSVLANAGSDVDSGAVKGIAVTAVDSSHGVWQYSTDGGSTWLALVGVSESAARLLRGNDANHRIRFVPQSEYNGTATITYRSWDQTSGTSAQTYSGLLAWIPFENSLIDAANNSLHGGTWSSGSNGGFSAVVPSDVGAGAYSGVFNGSSRVDLANSEALKVDNGVPFSMTAWIRTGFSDNVQRVILAKALSGAGSGNHTAAFFVSSNGRLRFDNFYVSMVESVTPVRTGNWVHVAVTYDGTDFRLFVDGKLDAVGRFSGSNETPATWTFSVGESLNTAFPGGTFVGNIDEVGFWNRTLTPSEVLSVRTSGISPTVNLTSTGGSTAYSANSGTATITVTAVNDAPVAVAQAVTTPEDTAKAITLSGTDVEGSALSYVVVTQPTKGVLSGTAPNLTYTPNANVNGSDSFTFKVNDGTLDSAVATVSITVTAVNDAPVAVAQAVTTPEDTAKAITLSGTDVEGSALTYSVATQPTKGTLSGTAPNLTYTPNANANGSDSFTFVANDGVQTSVAATVSISITAVNDAPTISSAAFQKIYETVNPSRNQSGAIVYSQGYGTGASDAASQFSATGQSISRIRYRMDLTVGGTARYAEATFDGWSGVKASDLRVPDDTSANKFALQRDVANLSVDSNYQTVSLGSGFSGRLEIWPYNYVPQANDSFQGGSSATYDFNDTYWPNDNGHGSFQVHNVTLSETVFGWNMHRSGGPPEIGFGNSASGSPDWTGSTLGSENWKLQILAETGSVPSAFNFTEDTPGNLTFHGTPFVDVDGDLLTVSLVASSGTLSAVAGTGIEIGGAASTKTFKGSLAALNAYFTVAGNVVYQAPANVNGNQSLTLSVSDGNLSTSLTAVLVVASVNDAPVALAQSVTTPEDTAKAITLSGTDVEGSALSYAVVTQPTKGVLSGTAPNLTYTPNANVNGSDSFTFKVNDGTLDSAVATVSITVTAVNDRPTFKVPQELVVTEDVASGLVFPQDPVGDVDGDLLTVGLSIQDGTIQAQAVSGITLAGGGQAILLSGTVSALNSYFNTAGNLTYRGIADNVASRVLEISVTDGSVPVRPPVSGYARWFDASKLDLAGGASVTRWADGSDFASDAVTIANKGMPTYVKDAGTGTGLGAVSFEANQALAFPRDSAIRSVFSVFKGSSFLLTDADSYHFHRPSDTVPADPLWVGWTSSFVTGGSTYVNGNLVNGSTFAMPTTGRNAFNLVSVLTTGPVAADSFNRDRVFHTGVQSHAEVILYDRVLTDAERVLVEKYLSSKWFGTGSGVGESFTSTVRFIPVNDAPVLGGSTGSTAASEQVAVVVDDGILVSDVDNASLASATVTVSGGYRSGEDVLGYVGDSQAHGNISGSFNPSTGVLTLTSAGASSSLAQWQAALRSVTYLNTSDAPNTAVRTVAFLVDDGVSTSAAVTRTVSVSSVNDAPSLSGITVNGTEDTTYTFPASSFSGNAYRDPESTALVSLRVETLPTTGELKLGANPVVAGQVIMASELGTLSYVPAANENGSKTFTVTVSDGVASSAAATVAISLAAVNDAPVASGTATLESIPEDGGVGSPGQTIQGLFSANFSDAVDGNQSALTAIAITVHSIDSTRGAWQYSVGGQSWTALPSSSLSAAFVLGASDRLRFVPVANYNGSATPLEARLVESGGAALATGDLINLSSSGLQVSLNQSSLIGWSSMYSSVFSPDRVLDNQSGSVSKDIFANNYWLGADRSSTGYFIIDLGSATDLSRVELYNTSNTGYNDRGTEKFHIEVAGAISGNGATSIALVNSKTVASGTLTAAVVGANPLAQSFSLQTDGVIPRYVRFVVDSSRNNNPGLNEIRLFAKVEASGGVSRYSLAAVPLVHTVTAVNDAPVAVAQAVTTPEDTAQTITLSGTDVEGSALSYAVVTQPTKGVLSGTAPNLTYTPNANANGSDSFTFKVNDGAVDSAVATVSITVTAVNDAPVAVAQAVTTPEDTVQTITLSGTDVEGSALSYSVVTQPTMGVLSGTAPNLTYTPNANANGSDSFTFKVNDGAVDSAVATVSITVTAVNDAPVAVAQAVTTPEDTAQTITLSGTDVEGSALSYAVVTQPTKGVLSGTAPNLTYTPNANANGSDSFTFKVNDGAVDSAVATVSITVTAVNDAPNLTVPDSQSVAESEDLVFAVESSPTVTDPDGDPLNLRLSVAHGTLTVTLTSGGAVIVEGSNAAESMTLRGTPGQLNDALSTLRYRSVAEFSGNDSIALSVIDDGGLSASAVISIAVESVDNPPVAVSQVVRTREEESVKIVLEGVDPEGRPVEYFVMSEPTRGLLRFDGNLAFYTPNPDATGVDSFNFRVNDGLSDSALARVDIEITPVNDAPVLSSISVLDGALEDTPVSLTHSQILRLSDGADVDGDDIAFRLEAIDVGTLLQDGQPVLPGALLNPLGIWVWIPPAEFHGLAEAFKVVAWDGVEASSVPVPVTVNVKEQADPPSLSLPGEVMVDEDTIVAFNESMAIRVSDPDSTELVLNLSVQRGILLADLDQPALTVKQGGSGSSSMAISGSPEVLNAVLQSLRYRGDAEYSGPDELEIFARDPSDQFDSGRVPISVRSVDDPPVIDTVPPLVVGIDPLTSTVKTPLPLVIPLGIQVDAMPATASASVSVVSGDTSLVPADGVRVFYRQGWFLEVSRIIPGTDDYQVAPLELTVTDALRVSAHQSVELVLQTAPRIRTGPVGGQFALGGPIRLSVVAAGGAPLSYDWFRNGVLYRSTESPDLVVPATVVADAGRYSVRVINPQGQAESATVTVELLEPPRFVVRPRSQWAPVGGAATFEADAAGGGDLVYEWFRQGTLRYSGRVWSRDSLTLADSGAYELRVRNTVAVLRSGPVYLTVSQPRVEAKGWGDNSMRQISFGENWTNLVSVAAGGRSTVGLRADGSVVVSGSIGKPPRLKARAVSVVAGEEHAVALLEDGSLQGWGSESKAVSGLTQMTGLMQVVAGHDYTAGLDADGHLRVVAGEDCELEGGSWDEVSYSEIAGGAEALFGRVLKTGLWTTIAGKGRSVPKSDSVLSGVRLVSIGWFHGIGVSTSGQGLVGWGDGTYGQNAPPAQLPSMIRSVSAGRFHAVALGADNSVIAWGAGSSGSREWPHFGQSVVPDGILAAQAVAGGWHTVVLKHRSPDLLAGLTAQTVHLGEPVSLAVVVDGLAPIGYTWKKNGVVIAGQTGDVLRIPSSKAEDSGTYSVTATTPFGSVSSEAGVAVISPPTVVNTPATRSVNQGAAETLSVNPEGTGPFTYQWLLDNEPIDGATSGSYSIAQARARDGGVYRVRITGPGGTITPTIATVGVVLIPSVVKQPVGASVVLGKTLTLQASVSGTAPLSHQWQKLDSSVTGRWQPISGATAPILSIPVAQLSTGGSYRLLVANAAGSVTSAEVTVQVIVPVAPATPDILVTQATGGLTRSVDLPVVKDGVARELTAAVDSVIRFTAAYTGTDPVQFQWLRDGAIINGARSAVLELPPLDAASKQDGLYQVRLVNGAGPGVAATGPGIRLTTLGVPRLMFKPATEYVAQFGNNVNFLLETAGVVSSVSWFKDGGQLVLGPGTRYVLTGGSLAIFNVETGDAGAYQGVLENAAGKLVTPVIRLRVTGTPPRITTQPVGAVRLAGSSYTLSVAATGPAGVTLSYQWYLNGKAIAGATSSTHSINGLGDANTGDYTVNVIARGNGSVVSVPANVRPVGIPVVVRQPVDQNVTLGSPAQFVFKVQGDASSAYPTRYQWYNLNGPIPDSTTGVAGQQTDTLTVTHTEIPYGGVSQYYCVAENAAGRVVSAPSLALVLKSLGEVARSGETNAVQTLKLVPGWNAVHLEVEPDDPAVESVFAGIPWTSIWRFKNRRDRVEFIQDMSEAAWSAESWLVRWPQVAPGSGPNPHVFDNSLTKVSRDTAYLIHVGGTNQLRLTLAGGRGHRPVKWVGDSYNLTGLPVDSSAVLSSTVDPDNTGPSPGSGTLPAANPAPPYLSVREMIGSQPSLWDAKGNVPRGMYRLTPEGTWVAMTATDPVRPGEAYWIFSKGVPKGSGSFDVELDYGESLDFPDNDDRRTVRLVNLKDTPTTVRVQLKAPGSLSLGELLTPSNDPKFGTTNYVAPTKPSNQATLGVVGATNLSPIEVVMPTVAGRVPINLALSGEITLAPGEVRLVALMANRSSVGIAGWKNLIVFSDGVTTYQVPSSIRRAVTLLTGKSVTKRKGNAKSGSVETLKYPGLWVGRVTVNGVSTVNGYDTVRTVKNFVDDEGVETNAVEVSYQSKTNMTDASPVANALEFNVLVHVDNGGQAKILQEVYLMQAPSGADGKPGSFVLITDRRNLTFFRGTALKGRERGGRRLSSLVLGLNGAARTNGYMAMSGSLVPGGRVAVALGVDSQSPLNPFYHKFHPDHDNLTADFKVYKEEAYGFARDISIAVNKDQDGGGRNGSEVMKGVYSEVIRGLHRNPIRVEGPVELIRVSDIGVINPSSW